MCIFHIVVYTPWPRITGTTTQQMQSGPAASPHVTFMKLIMSPCKTAIFAKSSDHVFLQILCAKASKYVLVAKHTAELAATDMV